MTTTDIDLSSTYEHIALTALVPHPDNVRSQIAIGTTEWREFEASIKSMGIVQPLVVRAIEDEMFQIVAGHRRFRAAQRLGLAVVPCVVRTLTDAQVTVLMLVENLQRNDLDPVDEALGYFRLIDLGMTLADLASKVGRSKKHVGDRLKMLGAPAELLAAVRKNECSIETALAYAKTSDVDIVEYALQFVAEHNIDYARALNTAVFRVNERKERAALLAKAEKKGCVVLQGNSMPAKHKNLEDLGLDLATALKAGLVVKAFIQYGRTVQYCTDDVAGARAVLGEKDPALAARKETERTAKREQREQRVADDERLRAAAAKSVGTTELLERAAAVIASTLHNDEAKWACQALGFDAPADEQWPRWGEVLLSNATPKQVVQVAYVTAARSRYQTYWQDAKAQLIASE